MALTNSQRVKIVKELLEWRGTPYRGHSARKHFGVDCGQLVYGVYRNCGYLPIDLPLPTDYRLDVSQHRASVEFVGVVNTYMREIPESEVQPADVVVFRLGLAYAHAGTIVSWPNRVVHASGRGVKETRAISSPRLRKASKRFFTLKDEFCVENFAIGSPASVEPTRIDAVAYPLGVSANLSLRRAC
jgi:cell wall-associated NlpC family hydrolase